MTDIHPAVDQQLLVDRYYSLAEELNSKGSLELAVPFYRQTIALLLANRDQDLTRNSLLSQLQQASSDVDGVLTVAENLKPSNPAISESELLRQIAALEEELSLASCREISSALEELRELWGKPHAQLLGLMAKVQILDGELLAAREFFEQAYSLDPDCLKISMNTAASRLACGDPEAALVLLRPLISRIDELSSIGSTSSFWGNLAMAELEIGERQRALEALNHLLACGSEDVPFAFWLDQAESWKESGLNSDVQSLLELLKDHIGDLELSQRLLPLLAEVLELMGSYREAALVYRELLSPQLCK